MSQTAVQVQERPGERASALLPSYWCREYKIDRSEGAFWLNGKTAAVKKVPFLLQISLPSDLPEQGAAQPERDVVYGPLNQCRHLERVLCALTCPLHWFPSAGACPQTTSPSGGRLLCQIAQNLLFWGYFSVIMGMDFTDRRLLYESS